MKQHILKTLKLLEKKHNVKIVWAIESGSRAWGFASEDSDYDVRCMHMSDLDAYLGLVPPAPQLNFVDGELDIESWDIQKFAKLCLKSNPQIAEWLRSPIIYRDSPVKDQLRKYFDAGCSLEFLREHYIRMAKQNYHKYMGSGVSHSCKKYLYVLRGIACAEYIRQVGKLPPLPYKDVIPYLPKKVQEFFEKCVVQKNSTEKAVIISSPEITVYIERMLNESFNRNERYFTKEKELNAYIIKLLKRKK